MVQVSLVDENGRSRGRLCLSVLPTSKATEARLLGKIADAGTSSRAPEGAWAVEGCEYRYIWSGLDTALGDVTSDPEEIFQADALDGRSGRFRPGLSTGTIDVVLRARSEVIGHLELEIRSRKLNYESEYRWMLRDIAQEMTELLMERFSTSATRFEVDESRDAATLFQRFAFLRALLYTEAFQLGLGEILRRPHVAWERRVERVSPGAGLGASSHAVRQLSKAGPRIPWQGGIIPSLPGKVERLRTEATHDTTPNRFVKFALERWRQVVGDIDRGLAIGSPSPVVARGRREVAQVLGELDNLLNADLFRDLRPLSRFPADDQTLQKREGYRDVFKAYVEFELASKLSWRRVKDSYDATQRDVATLYEYWAFIRLAKTIASLLNRPFDMSPLIESSNDGLGVSLRAGKETVLVGTVEREGRTLEIELCYNRTYNQAQRHGSWTRPMRPDYSLSIRPRGSEEVEAAEAVVLHFDAKYRVNFLAEILGSDADASNVEGETKAEAVGWARGGALREDLLKMHAYRDAIRRTAGAYVLYPGVIEDSKAEQFSEYHELLPGLGAFVLRPTESGSASGENSLRRFIDDVLDHVSARLTQHERGRFWEAEIYGPSLYAQAEFLAHEPPPETPILLGFVKSMEHWNWIQSRRLYNVRVEGRQGGISADATLWQCQVILLYCPQSGQVALSRIISAPARISIAAMSQMGYPEPRADYWCIELARLRQAPFLREIDAGRIGAYLLTRGDILGAPAIARWSELGSL